ncbi:MAG: hypothetical protein GY866_23415 [Proteobacteria bacterium]|nr:hypothetical protein [Pseudomonadota bacterium]
MYFIIPFVLVPVFMLIYLFQAPKEYKTHSLIFIDETLFNHPTLKDYNLTIHLKDRIPTIQQQMLGNDSLYEILDLSKSEEQEIANASLMDAARGRMEVDYVGPGLVSITFSGRNPRRIKKIVDRAVIVYQRFALEPCRGIGKKLLDRMKTRDRILSSQIIPKFNQAKLRYLDAKRNFTELASELMFAREEYRTWLEKRRKQEKAVEKQTKEIIPLKDGELDKAKVVQIVEPAIVPAIPYKPQKKRMFLLSIVAGALAGAFFVYVRQFFDHSIRSPSEVEESLAVAVIGRVPRLWTQERIEESSDNSDGVVEKKKGLKIFGKKDTSASSRKKRPKTRSRPKISLSGLKRSILPLSITLILIVAGLSFFGTSSKTIVLDKRLRPTTMKYLEDLLSSQSGKASGSKGIVTFSLNQTDMSALLEVLNSKTSRGNANCVLVGERLSVTASLKLMESPFRRYLNIQAVSNIIIQQGQLELDLDSFKAGSIRLPAFLVESMMNSFVVPRLMTMIQKNPKTKAFLNSVQKLEITDSRLTIAYGSNISLMEVFAMGSQSKSRMAAEEGKQVIMAYKTIVDLVQQLPANENQFRSVMEAGFSYAVQLTDQGMTAVKSNRIALSALGMYFGDVSAMKSYFGEGNLNQIMDPDNELESYHANAKKHRSSSVIYKRGDWPQHFVVSAMLTALLGQEMADIIGINKELKDLSGTGFSFSDIWADRAGVAFANWILKDEEAAQKAQRDIQQGFLIEDYFPFPSNLPKNMSRAEFESVYGSIKSSEFRQQIEEIDSTLAMSPAYQGF